MPQITIENLHIGFRGPALLDGVSCVIERGERIGLLGRNGSGKTTLLRLLTGEVESDGGSITFAAGTTVATLPQDVPSDLVGTIADVVATGVISPDDHPVPEWEADLAVQKVLSRMDLDGGTEVATLSSGMKRRVLLARAIVSSPDVLLLDEPTNHLDVEAITWLEGFLSRCDMTLIFVTHDRMFLRKLARRILEIDRGRLFDWTCDYDTFLVRKEDALAAEEKQNALFDKRLAEEEVWIRQGIKARRTRNEGRVRALKELRRIREERRTKIGTANLAIQSAEKSGVLVADLKKVTYHHPGKPILTNFTTTVLRGDKIGIVGPNGAGKTTLLRVLLGELAPQEGTVRQGTQLKVAYFDQLRQVLDENATVQENIGDGAETITIGGKSRHIIGYLQDFLFSAERARTPVRFLSGGERNRVLLARLFAKPANVIVLDEPTNDLDTETLELLEERLVQFEGTVLVVSHDRAFLNNVVTSLLVFEPGGVKEYSGGYDDWFAQRPKTMSKSESSKSESSKKSPNVAKASPANEDAPRRLSFKEKHELKQVEAKIERLDQEIAAIHEQMASPGFYQQGDQVASVVSKLKDLEGRLAKDMARWEYLASRDS